MPPLKPACWFQVQVTRVQLYNTYSALFLVDSSSEFYRRWKMLCYCPWEFVRNKVTWVDARRIYAAVVREWVEVAILPSTRVVTSQKSHRSALNNHAETRHAHKKKRIKSSFLHSTHALTSEAQQACLSLRKKVIWTRLLLLYILLNQILIASTYTLPRTLEAFYLMK